MLYLKQSTASQNVLIGPFVDDSDGVTAETGLTINASDIRLSANGGNMAAKNSGGGTHDENGWYQITLDATDTATVGRLQVSCKVAGSLPVFIECQVLEEAVYDALFASGATGELAVDVAKWGGTAVGSANVLIDGAITAAKIADDAITEAKIADDALTGDKIAESFSQEIAAIVEEYIVNDGDATAVMQAIADKIASDWVAGDASPLAVASAVWANGTRTLTSGANLNIPGSVDITNACLTALDDYTLDQISDDVAALQAKLLAYIQLLARKDEAVATDNATELAELNADGGSGSGSFDNTKDAMETVADVPRYGDTVQRSKQSANSDTLVETITKPS